MLVPTFAVIFTLAIYQVASAPLDNRVQFDGTFKRLYLPYIQSVAKDGTKTILTSEDLVNLHKKLDEIPATTLHQFVGINGFTHTLSDHQLRLMAEHKVAAIVDPENLNKPGFGHLFLTIDNDGIVQTFVYNLSLQEATKMVKHEGYPNSSSKDSYHHNPSSSPSDVTVGSV